MKEKINVKDIFIFSGAILAFNIGAGFATGQEAMQFYSHLGVTGSFLAGLTTMFLYSWYCSQAIQIGHQLRFKDANQIYHFICGKYFGIFFEWAIPIIMFMVVSIMLAGAGATAAEHYGLDPFIGSTTMAALVLITVILGLKKLVNTIGLIGPVILVFVLFISLVAILQNPEGLSTADDILATLDIKGAYSSWFMCGLSYAAFSITGLSAFMAGMGKNAKSDRDAFWGGIFGGIFLILGIMLVSTGILANIADTYNKEVPALVIAQKSFPFMDSVLAVMLLLGIFTTAVPMLWIACNRIAVDDKSLKYKVAATALIIIDMFGAKLKFSSMIGMIYPLIGYMGMVMFVGMFYTVHIKKKTALDVDQSLRDLTV